MTAYDREFAAEAASLDDVTAGQVAEVRRVAFDEFLAGHGYDEDGMFDVEEMELAFETGWQIAQAAITAQRPPAPEVRHWDGAVNQATRLIDWILTGDGTARYHDGPSAIVIDVPRGVHRSGMLTAVPGDWIVRMPDGTFRVLSEDAQPAPEVAALNKRVASLYRLVDEVLSEAETFARKGIVIDAHHIERWRQRADSA